MRRRIAVCRPPASSAAGCTAFRAEEHREMAHWQAGEHHCVTAWLWGAASFSALAASPALTAVATPSPVLVGTPLTVDVLFLDASSVDIPWLPQNDTAQLTAAVVPQPARTAWLAPVLAGRAAAAQRRDQAAA
jgi:hypothetical protein